MSVVYATFGRRMDPRAIRPGDIVAASPVGPGKVTDISDAGYPRVDGVAVVWLRRTDGVVFNPHGHELP